MTRRCVGQSSKFSKQKVKCDSLLDIGKLSDLEVNFLLVHHFMGLWNLSTRGNSSVQMTYLTRFWSFDVTGYGVHQPFSKFPSMWANTWKKGARGVIECSKALSLTHTIHSRQGDVFVTLSQLPIIWMAWWNASSNCPTHYWSVTWNLKPRCAKGKLDM